MKEFIKIYKELVCCGFLLLCVHDLCALSYTFWGWFILVVMALPVLIYNEPMRDNDLEIVNKLSEIKEFLDKNNIKYSIDEYPSKERIAEIENKIKEDKIYLEKLKRLKD